MVIQHTVEVRVRPRAGEEAYFNFVVFGTPALTATLIRVLWHAKHPVYAISSNCASRARRNANLLDRSALKHLQIAQGNLARLV
jgi:hypothetical protein